MLEQLIKHLLTIITILVVSWILFRIILIRKKKSRYSIRFELILFLFFSYVISVMTVTIIPLPIPSFEKPGHGGINIIPIKNIIMGMANVLFPENNFETEKISENLFGNIIMFAPLGMFLPFLSPRFRSLRKVTVFALICSTSIELIQLSLRLIEIYRFVDIDDIILNTSGAALGFVIIDRIFFKKKKPARLNKL